MFFDFGEKKTYPPQLCFLISVKKHISHSYVFLLKRQRRPTDPHMQCCSIVRAAIERGPRRSAALHTPQCEDVKEPATAAPGRPAKGQPAAQAPQLRARLRRILCSAHARQPRGHRNCGLRPRSPHPNRRWPSPSPWALLSFWALLEHHPSTTAPSACQPRPWPRSP